MALHTKKVCSCCGKPAGLTGFHLLDGMLCADCGQLCSPLLHDKHHLTAEQLRRHLAYRAANTERIKRYRPDLILGMGRGIQVTADTEHRLFAVAVAGNIYEECADVFSYDQVKVVQMNRYGADYMPETRVFQVILDAPEAGIDMIQIPESDCTSQTFSAMWDFFNAILDAPYERL